MFHPFRSIASLLAVVIAALTLGACGGSSSSSELTVYSGRAKPLAGPLLDRFQDQTGIKLNIRYGDTAEMAATIREEGKNSPADVFFSQDAGALGALQGEGLLDALRPKTLERVPARFRSTTGRWVGVSGRARVIAYDKRVLREADVPDSVFDLTDPRWRGKVAWAPTNGSFQAFVSGMRKLVGDARTEQWLRDMKDNGTKAYDNNVLARDAIAAGEVQLAVTNHYYVLESRAEDGADYPVDISFVDGKDPGALINVTGVGILETSDKKAEAQQLVDFLLAPASQAYFAEKTFEYPLVPGTRGPSGVPALDAIEHPDIDLSDLDDLKGTLELLAKVGVL